MKELFGEVVRAVYSNEDQHSLFFDVGPGRMGGSYVRQRFIEFPLDSDCCSESWWADIVGTEALINQRVMGIEELEMPDVPEDDKRSRQEYDQAYGYRLKTRVGYVDLVFRNSSNGYYGGDLDDAVWHEQMPPGVYCKIVTDWRAEDVPQTGEAPTPTTQL